MGRASEYRLFVTPPDIVNDPGDRCPDGDTTATNPDSRNLTGTGT